MKFESLLHDADEGDTRLLRRALGAFATGVTVVCAFDARGEPVGLTVNSFTSVSLDPPLVLFCLDRRSSRLAAFEACGAFAIHVLHGGQQEVSGHFGGRAAERFASLDWECSALGTPVLREAAAVFECERHQVLDGGDHRIFIGRVRRFGLDAEREPLLYFQGGYRALAPRAGPLAAETRAVQPA